MTQKPREGDFRELNQNNFPGDHSPGIRPLRSLRLRRSFGKLVSIHPRSVPDNNTTFPLFSLLQHHQHQPRSQSSPAISDVTSPVKLVGKIRAIPLGFKPPLVTRIARTDLGTRLHQHHIFVVLTPPPPPTPHFYCFHATNITFQLFSSTTTTTTMFPLFSRLHHHPHHISIVFTPLPTPTLYFHCFYRQ